MSPALTLLAVATGGALGAVGRHLIAQFVRHGTAWPDHFATLAANLIGCFAIGVAYVGLEGADRPPWVHGLLVTGLLGAFTTFSTFSYETVALLRDGDWTRATLYTGLSFALGLTAILIGIGAASVLLRVRG